MVWTLANRNLFSSFFLFFHSQRATYTRFSVLHSSSYCFILHCTNSIFLVAVRCFKWRQFAFSPRQLLFNSKFWTFDLVIPWNVKGNTICVEHDRHMSLIFVCTLTLYLSYLLVFFAFVIECCYFYKCRCWKGKK
jgi:hypothetical protein